MLEGELIMSKIIIIFASMSGNTEEMANTIAEGITEISDVSIEKVDIMDGPEASMLEDYDGIILGAYTWGDGELPDDFLDFYEDMDHFDLTGKKSCGIWFLRFILPTIWCSRRYFDRKIKGTGRCYRPGRVKSGTNPR